VPKSIGRVKIYTFPESSEFELINLGHNFLLKLISDMIEKASLLEPILVRFLFLATFIKEEHEKVTLRAMRKNFDDLGGYVVKKRKSKVTNNKLHFQVTIFRSLI